MRLPNMPQAITEYKGGYALSGHREQLNTAMKYLAQRENFQTSHTIYSTSLFIQYYESAVIMVSCHFLILY